jgi:hypothetical protein
LRVREVRSDAYRVSASRVPHLGAREPSGPGSASLLLRLEPALSEVEGVGSHEPQSDFPSSQATEGDLRFVVYAPQSIAGGSEMICKDLKINRGRGGGINFLVNRCGPGRFLRD